MYVVVEPKKNRVAGLARVGFDFFFLELKKLH